MNEAFTSYELRIKELERELAEAHHIIDRLTTRHATAQEVIKVLTHHNDALLKTNTYLRSCPRPPYPERDYSGDYSEEYERCWQFYEAYLASNPPEEFK